MPTFLQILWANVYAAAFARGKAEAAYAGSRTDAQIAAEAAAQADAACTNLPESSLANLLVAIAALKP